MFDGTILGNLTGFLYFIMYILAGVFLVHKLFPSFSSLVKLWLGCVSGCVILMWLPVLFSFVFGFNTLSHYIAAALLIAAMVLVAVLKRKMPSTPLFDYKHDDLISLAIIIPMIVFYTLVEFNHILAPADDGGMIFGQSTYFDANIHLSFITTPVVQGEMPFYYNIYPVQQVSYPFLCDTISSSIYVWGSSLRLAYVIPTILGAFNVFLGAILFFRLWLKKLPKAIIAWVLFFFNGGFGFMYFFDGLKQSTGNFDRIFTALYETPTNLNDKMIRWVNTVCDMMIPQRATLFGWMMLFAVLYLLYKAVFLKEKKFFIPAAVLAGLTPLISTHIFLSIALISAVWMISRLFVMCKLDKKYAGYASIGLLALGVLIFLIVCIQTGTSITNVNYDKAGFTTLCVCGVLIALIYLYLIILALSRGNFKEILTTWGLYLGIVLVFALPQLICFTFKQSAGDNFLRPHFNWINSQDSYFWFYVKNVGIPALLIIPAILNANNRTRSIVAPVAVIMLIAETFAFQPNPYDNNKLIYPAFVLVCGVVADYMHTVYEKLKGIGGRRIIATFVLILCVISGTLSMGREYVAGEYEIFSAPQVRVSWWIQNNLEPDAMLLTNDRYNNAITGLTGRNVVCGSNSFFSTHGLSNFSKLQRDIRAMYADPEGQKDLFVKYEVDYIVVGVEERSSYTVNEDGLSAIGEVIYNVDDVKIYKLYK